MYYAYYLDVVYQDFTEAGRKHVSGFLVASVTNRGHQELALETPSHSVVNTLGLTPAPLEKQTNQSQCLDITICVYPNCLLNISLIQGASKKPPDFHSCAMRNR